MLNRKVLSTSPSQIGSPTLLKIEIRFYYRLQLLHTNFLVQIRQIVQDNNKNLQIINITFPVQLEIFLGK